MLDLITPTDHAGAYEWAAVFLAHFTIGIALTALVAAALDAMDSFALSVGDVSPVLVTAVYFVAWEGIVQRYGAGLADAAVDTLAVGIGGASGLYLWRRAGVRLAAAIALAGAVLWRGVRARK